MHLRTFPHDRCSRPHCGVCGTPAPKRKATWSEVAGMVVYFVLSAGMLLLVVGAALWPRS